MWKNIILAISLALNVFVLGAVGYYSWQITAFTDGKRMESRMDRMQKHILSELDGNDRLVAERTINEHRPIVRDVAHELRQARRDAIRALRAPTPDPQELVRALDRSHMAAGRLNNAIHDTLRDLAIGLSPEARRELSKRVRDNYDPDDE